MTIILPIIRKYPMPVRKTLVNKQKRGNNKKAERYYKFIRSVSVKNCLVIALKFQFLVAVPIKKALNEIVNTKNHNKKTLIQQIDSTLNKQRKTGQNLIKITTFLFQKLKSEIRHMEN